MSSFLRNDCICRASSSIVSSPLKKAELYSYAATVSPWKVGSSAMSFGQYAFVEVFVHVSLAFPVRPCTKSRTGPAGSFCETNSIRGKLGSTVRCCAGLDGFGCCFRFSAHPVETGIAARHKSKRIKKRHLIAYPHARHYASAATQSCWIGRVKGKVLPQMAFVVGTQQLVKADPTCLQSN